MYLVIFDCDGTLVDSQHHIVGAMETAFANEGLKAPDRNAILSIVGLSLHEAVSTLCAPFGNLPVERIAEGYKHAFGDMRADPEHAPEPLYSGALQVLEALHNHDEVLVGMATGKSRRGVDNVVRLHGLEGHFVTIQTADTSPSKPHPDMILQAMRETGAEPAKTIMIGDTSFDMAMAKAAGVHGLGVSWGYHDVPTMQAAGAHSVIDGFSQLENYLSQLFNLDFKEVV